MHNPTRRVKRFRQPLSSRTNQLPDTDNAHFNLVPGEARTTSTANTSYYARHPHAAPPDTLRGAMLVMLIVVIMVLYFVLWELERSSFAPMSKLNLTRARTVMAASPLGSRSMRYPPAVVYWQNRPASSSGEESTAPSSKPSRTIPNFAWPPPSLITRVLDEHHDDTLDLTEKLDERTQKDDLDITKPLLSSFDAAYCNGPCRFLIPVRIGEQESKARVHFMQLSMLARRLNRTIVLPNVGKSRMSACSEWPFDTYYDANEFVRGSDDAAGGSRVAIDLEEFAKWVDGRPVLPNSFVVSMESIRQDRRGLLSQEDVPFVVERTDVDPKILSCLEPKLARLRPSLPDTALSISFDPGSLKMESSTPTRLMQLLSNSLNLGTDTDTNLDFDLMMKPGYEYAPQYTNASLLSLADIHVLILDYDLRHPLFDPSVLGNFNLHYAPALYDLADRLSQNLGPFLGVHWRMETVPAQNLAWCAASLVSTLHALLQDDVTGKDVQHVWLATDHPRPLSSFMDVVQFPVDDRDVLDGVRVRSGKDDWGPTRKSSTFKTLSLEHDDAIGMLTEAFQPGGDLEAWTVTDLAEQLRRYPYVEGRFDVNATLLDDSGVFGILDKLVVVQARVFVSGSTECSKTRFA